MAYEYAGIIYQTRIGWWKVEGIVFLMLFVASESAALYIKHELVDENLNV